MHCELCGDPGYSAELCSVESCPIQALVKKAERDADLAALYSALALGYEACERGDTMAQAWATFMEGYHR